MKIEHPKIIGYTAAITSVMLMSPLGVFVRNISANEYIVTFARLSIGLVFLVCFLYWKKATNHIKLSKYPYPLLVTGILMAMAILCYTNAINSTTLANAVFLLYLGPLLAVGISAILLREKFTLLNAGILFLAFLGFLFLLEFNVPSSMQESTGYLWGVGAAICYALFIVLNRKIPDEIPVLTRTFYQLLFGAMTMLPFLDVSIFSMTINDIYWLIAIGFFQGFLAISLAILAIKHLKTIEYGTISYIEPLMAALIGYALYSENLTLLQLIGCAVVIFGGLLQMIVTKSHNNAHRAHD